MVPTGYAVKCCKSLYLEDTIVLVLLLESVTINNTEYINYLKNENK